MPALSAAVTADLGKRLRDSRAELVGHIRSRLESPDQPAAVSVSAHLGQPDDISQADYIGDNEMAQLDQEQALLRAIDAALVRLEEGIANICAVCGEEIPQARLVAMPTVQTCIACQERIEKDSHMPPGHTM
jgi:phage/conjugal plasmid C-4 type zinc finger TraR family protein